MNGWCDFEFTFEGPGVATRTLDAKRFSHLFADILNQLFTDTSTELCCHLQFYRSKYSYTTLVVQWRDAHGHAFDYTFECTGHGCGDYNMDSEGCYRIESGDTMRAGDLCDALSYVDQIHTIIRKLRKGVGHISVQLLPKMYLGGEEPAAFWINPSTRRAIDFFHSDLSSELTNHSGFKMLSCWRVEGQTGVHAALTVGELAESSTLMERLGLTEQLSLSCPIGHLSIVCTDANGNLVLLQPLDVFAASWDELKHANFAGVYLGYVPDVLLMRPELQTGAVLEHMNQLFPGLRENAEHLLWNLWHEEPYCPNKNAQEFEDPIRARQSAHSLVAGAAGLTLRVSERILTDV